jgi:tetratricopeptide (TPR) repeat protein
MRYMPHCSAIFVAAILLAAPATVNAAVWCHVASGRDGGATTCRYRSFEQCMESRAGVGGSCYQDSSTGEQAAPRKSNKASETEQKKKATPDTASKPQPEPAKPQEQPAKQAAPVPTPAPQTAALQPSAHDFAAARQLIFAGQYEAGLAALRALGSDGNPDVATYIGLAHNKLGRVNDARLWYDKALAADPDHLLTLSYYGMLRAEQGDLRKARDDLEKIKRLCGGTGCKEYIALNGVIASNRR